jgi:hypothetical protein
MAEPVLSNESEVWTKTENNKRRVEAGGMRFLNSVAGLHSEDQMRSDDVRRELQINITNRISFYGSKLYQYVEEIEENIIPKKVLNYSL